MPKKTHQQKSQTKIDFITQIAQKVEVSKKEADRLVSAVLDTLQENMARGINQVFSGFGAFIVKDRLGRTGRNPKTGEPVVIKAKRVPTFKASNQLKAAVDNQSHS